MARAKSWLELDARARFALRWRLPLSARVEPREFGDVWRFWGIRARELRGTQPGPAQGFTARLENILQP